MTANQHIYLKTLQNLENYVIKNLITGKNSSPEDIDILNFVEPKRKKMESFFKFIIETDFTVWKDEQMINNENTIVSEFNVFIKEKPTKPKKQPKT